MSVWKLNGQRYGKGREEKEKAGQQKRGPQGPRQDGVNKKRQEKKT